MSEPKTKARGRWALLLKLLAITGYIVGAQIGTTGWPQAWHRRSGTITGVMLDAQSQPWAKVRVRAVTHDGPEIGYRSDPEETLTGGDGGFSFRLVPGEDIVVRAIDRGRLVAGERVVVEANQKLSLILRPREEDFR